MNPATVYLGVTLAGCSLELAGDSLRVRGPREVLTPDLLAALRENKAVLLEHLKAPTLNPLPLVAAEDLAKLVEEHLANCSVCTRGAFSGDEETALCPAGQLLHQHLAEARRCGQEAASEHGDAEHGPEAPAPVVAAVDDQQAAEQPATRGPRREGQSAPEVGELVRLPPGAIVIPPCPLPPRDGPRSTDPARLQLCPDLAGLSKTDLIAVEYLFSLQAGEPVAFAKLRADLVSYCAVHPNGWYRQWHRQWTAHPGSDRQARWCSSLLARLQRRGLVEFGWMGSAQLVGLRRDVLDRLNEAYPPFSDIPITSYSAHEFWRVEHATESDPGDEWTDDLMPTW